MTIPEDTWSPSREGKRNPFPKLAERLRLLSAEIEKSIKQDKAEIRRLRGGSGG